MLSPGCVKFSLHSFLKKMTENILNALHFAAIKHKDQRSYTSGYTDPYINHVIGLMSVLTDLADETDPILLQAATLQGTIEWTDATIDDIKKEFGDEVARLVNEVTILKESDRLKTTTKAKEHMTRCAKVIMCADILWELTALVDCANGREMSGPEKARIQEALAEANQYEFAGMNKNLQDELNSILAFLASFADCTDDQCKVFKQDWKKRPAADLQEPVSKRPKVLLQDHSSEDEPSVPAEDRSKDKQMDSPSTSSMSPFEDPFTQDLIVTDQEDQAEEKTPEADEESKKGKKKLCSIM